MESWEFGRTVRRWRDRVTPADVGVPTCPSGAIELDCDALLVAGDDLRIIVCTAEPGTEDAERPALAIVLGTKALVDQAHGVAARAFVR